MNPIKAKDLIDGDNNEIIAKKFLELLFSVSLTKLSKYHTFDFIDENGVYYEVKGRNNTYAKYPTTMIGYNKICFANELEKKSVFVFKFTDGIYYYEYDKEQMDQLIICDGGRRDRGYAEYKKYAYININYLTRF